MPEVLPDVELPEPPDEHRPPRLWGSGGAGGAGGVVEETVAGMLLTCFAVAVVRAYLFVVPVYLLGAYIYASWESLPRSEPQRG